MQSAGASSRPKQQSACRQARCCFTRKQQRSGTPYRLAMAWRLLADGSTSARMRGELRIRYYRSQGVPSVLWERREGQRSQEVSRSSGGSYTGSLRRSAVVRAIAGCLSGLVARRRPTDVKVLLGGPTPSEPEPRCLPTLLPRGVVVIAEHDQRPAPSSAAADPLRATVRAARSALGG